MAAFTRGIRGATTVAANDVRSILEATRELLTEMQRRNEFSLDAVASVFFTVTGDLDTTFPARAAREMGWDLVPMLCTSEIPVPGSLPRCIRVLLLLNTDRRQDEINHVYLREAVALRPDLAGGTSKGKDPCREG